PADELDEIEAEMLAEWRDVSEDLLAPLEAAIAGASSYEDAMAALEAAAPDMRSSKLVETLVKGMFMARATGDVNDG
ncbi:MAG: DUF935 domain-containing protein, partial [Rhodobacteraceae bacterium]|nr:DUF935 domain-containing protein [Paracoccaceae bacterium]